MNLESLDNERILALLPHKLQVKFAYECCLELKDELKDPRPIKALEVIGRWLKDEATKEEVKTAAENAYNAVNAAANATYATYAAKAAYSSSYTFTGSRTVASCADADARSKLLKFVDNLSDMEKVLYL